MDRPREPNKRLQKLECSRKSDREQRKRILEEYHIESGYGGLETMEFMKKHKYYWPSYHKDIKDRANNCEQCLRASGERFNTKNRPIKVKKPNEL